MLLTCCFRENKEDRDSVRKVKRLSSRTGFSVEEEEKSLVDGGNGRVRKDSSRSHRRDSLDSRSSTLRIATAPHRDGKDRREKKAKAPLQKEAKRLMKQMSQESFARQSAKNVPGGAASSQSIPYIDQSPAHWRRAASAVQDDKFTFSSVTSSNGPESLCLQKHGWRKAPSSPCSEPFDDPSSPCRQPPQRGDDGVRSAPNLPTSTPVHKSAFTSINGFVQPENTTNAAASRSSQIAYSPRRPFSSASATASETSSSCQSPLRIYGDPQRANNFNSLLAIAESKTQGRGITRSNASYGIQQLLQDQIIQEEYEQKQKQDVQQVSEAYEEKLTSLKAEHDLAVQNIQREKTTALNNAKNDHQTELKRQLESSQKTVDQLKASHEEEIESLREKFECQMKETEDEHCKMLTEYEFRDQAWQIEKEDVLSEVQRLKEEAKRYIAILSQESEDDESLSSFKRQSLTKEVESLQLVVEMRTSELHRLREEREKHVRQLEDFDNLNMDLKKMSTRVEDLQAQLDAKTRIERQLSLEKSNLANSFEVESKTKAMMSMQVEGLQWRIKNNFELPPTQVFSPNKENKNFLDDSCDATTPNNNSILSNKSDDVSPTSNGSNHGGSRPAPAARKKSPRKTPEKPVKKEGRTEAKATNSTKQSRPLDLNLNNTHAQPKGESRTQGASVQQAVKHSTQQDGNGGNPQPDDNAEQSRYVVGSEQLNENNNNSNTDCNLNVRVTCGSSPKKIGRPEGFQHMPSPSDDRVPSRIPMTASGKD